MTVSEFAVWLFFAEYGFCEMVWSDEDSEKSRNKKFSDKVCYPSGKRHPDKHYRLNESNVSPTIEGKYKYQNEA